MAVESLDGFLSVSLSYSIVLDCERLPADGEERVGENPQFRGKTSLEKRARNPRLKSRALQQPVLIRPARIVQTWRQIKLVPRASHVPGNQSSTMSGGTSASAGSEKRKHRKKSKAKPSKTGGRGKRIDQVDFLVLTIRPDYQDHLRSWHFWNSHHRDRCHFTSVVARRHEHRTIDQVEQFYASDQSQWQFGQVGFLASVYLGG